MARASQLLAILILASLVAPTAAEDVLIVHPSSAKLDGSFARLQIIAGRQASGLLPEESGDITRSVAYRSSDPAVATVDNQGQVQAVGDGEAVITVTHEGHSKSIPVQVSNATQSKVEFMRDIRPILTKAGCAAAACHASQFGKGGFKLSVFGFDPRADYEAIARESRQRRINLASLDLSLLLRKPAMLTAHGGGKRFDVESNEYRTLRRWLENGAPPPAKEEVKVTKLQVWPKRRVGSLGYDQQLRVAAEYSDGTTRDITALAKYDSIDEGVVVVSEKGYAHTVGQGQTSIMIRYEGEAEIASFVVPYGKSIQLADWQSNNFIDELAAKKFQELGLQPSALCDDATFLRRAFLDATGSTPTLEESREFLQSTEPDKRQKLVDRLLGLTGDPQLDIYNDRYAAYWTLKWSDLIRNNSNSVGDQGMWALHNWIRESFRVNKSFDKFVRQLITAKGSIYSNGPANYFRINRNSSDLTESTAQLFLGVRLECAKCHHHPFEKYSQSDYYSLAAFFSRVSSKNSEEFGIFGRETIVMVRATGEVNHPRLRTRMQPTPLGGEPVDNELDRRIPLADWLTSPENELFSRSVANRYMGYLLGYGLVNPIDDMRSTNPPSNPELMDTLAQHFTSSGYDLKQLMRTIMVSRLYQLSSQPTEQNVADRRFFSHFKVKRIAAEPLLDAIDRATDSPTKFKDLPLGTRAIELPDAEYPNYFLKTFAKPLRASVCECERTPDESLAQALHTLNGDTVANKIADKKGRIARLIGEQKPHPEIVSEIYLAALCRPATEAELKFGQELLAASESPQQAYEDLLWALINSKQFLFVR